MKENFDDSYNNYNIYNNNIITNTNNINNVEIIKISEENYPEQIYKYVFAIYNSEKTLKDNKDFLLHDIKDYLIKLSDYNKFKEQIKYEFLVPYVFDKINCIEIINQYISSYKIEPENIEKIEIIDASIFSQENMPNEGYKLINEQLKKIICFENEEEEHNKLVYELDFPTIHLNSKNLDFLFHDYILDNRLILTKENYQILCISKAIIEYYNLNNNFKLKGKSDQQRWLLISNESTKNLLNFINNHEYNYEDENVIYELIDYISNKMGSDEIDNLIKIEPLTIKGKEEFKKYNEKNDIAIINPLLYYLLKAKSTKRHFLYYECYSESDGIVHIEFNEKEKVKYVPYNNILIYNRRIPGNSYIKSVVSYIKKTNIYNYFSYILGFSSKKQKIKKIENDYKKNNLIENDINTDSGIFTLIDNNNKDDNKDDNIIISNEKKEEIEIKTIETKTDEDFIEEFENISIEKTKDIKSNFKNCPGIGLQNIGATCYMNATLQCFSHIEKFINFFKYNSQVNNEGEKDKIKDDKNQTNLLYPSFKILIEKLWPNDYLNIKEKYYAPYDFKKQISEMNPLFEGIAANDSKDLVNFIIMTLHEELNKSQMKNVIFNENEIIDQTNKQLVFQNFMQDFSSKNQSIISDLFYAMNCNITECTYCQKKLYNYQIYFFIIFPLEEVRKFKYNNQLNFNNINFNNINFNNNVLVNNINNINNENNLVLNNKKVSIYDCFDFDKKINLMTGSNAMYCNGCKQTCDCTMQTYLVFGPEILILLLNRGKGKEFDVKIEFFEEINLYNYIEYKNTGFKYKLIGVISHIGESGMSGHFIAYCKDPINNQWNKFNDAIVSPVSDFQNEVINFAMPYLLFYQKIE